MMQCLMRNMGDAVFVIDHLARNVGLLSTTTIQTEIFGGFYAQLATENCVTLMVTRTTWNVLLYTSLKSRITKALPRIV
jgi:hypothetical protein